MDDRDCIRENNQLRELLENILCKVRVIDDIDLKAYKKRYSAI